MATSGRSESEAQQAARTVLLRTGWHDAEFTLYGKRGERAMHNQGKAAALLGGAALAAMLGGCAPTMPGRVAYYTPDMSGYSSPAAPPRPLNPYVLPAAPAPQDGGWGQEAAVAGGVVAGNEAVKAALSKVAGAGAGAEGAGAESAAAVPSVAAPLVEEGAGDGLMIVIERGFIWIAEHPYLLLESYKSTVRHRRKIRA